MLCLCAAQLKFWFQTDLGRENSASYYRQKDSCFWLCSPWSRVGHALRPIFMLWLVKIWQLSSWAKFMQHLENILRFFKSKGGADTPGPSPRSATDFVPTQMQKTEQNLGPILGFSKNKLRFFTGTNSDFRRRQTPIPKNQTPIFKNKLRFSKKKTSDFR